MVKFSQVNFQNCSNPAFKAFSVQTTWHKLGKQTNNRRKDIALQPQHGISTFTGRQRLQAQLRNVQ